MAVGSTKVVQVTNIAPQATKDQMQVLFGYLGKIEDIRLYPTIRDVSCPVQSRICYIKFIDPITVGIAQHMTNTVFIDRALIVIPVQNGEIPDEYYALEMTRNGTLVPGLNVNEPKLPMHVINTVQGSGSDQVILTTDPQLEATGLPNYPPLAATYDSAKVEETRRTILALNIDSSTPSADLITFFSSAGEVKYLRSCTSDVDNSTHYLIEYTDQASIINALKLNGIELNGVPIEIQHATQPIIKPQAKSNEAAQKEIEEAMSRFKEAQNMINASIEPVIGMLTKDKRGSRRSRSRSRERRRSRRSRSRSRSRRSRSRRRRSSSRSRKSRSRDRKRRSKSRSKKRSRSRSKRRSGSRNSKSRRSRSKSRSRKRSKSKERKSSRARSRDKDRKSRDRSRDRKRSRDRDRKSRERSKTKEKGRESKDRKSQSVDVEKKRSRSKSRSRSRRRSKSRDKRKERKRSRSRGTRRRSPTPKTSRKRSRTRSKDRKRDRRDKKDKKERSRSRSKDRKARSVRSRDRDRTRDRSKSKTKLPSKSYEDEKANSSVDIDREKEKLKNDNDEQFDKDSGEKSDNNMDISNSP